VALLVVGLLGVVFAGADVAFFVYAGADGINRGVAMIIVVELAAIGGLYRLLTRSKR
jgi:hypothetical protein